jgi:hypothetical protein
MNTTTPAAWRRITATVIGAGAIAVGVMASSAHAANATPLGGGCISASDIRNVPRPPVQQQPKTQTPESPPSTGGLGDATAA